MSKLIFCEGDLDLRVLQKIKDGMTDVTLEKGFGKKGMKAFMQGYLANYRGVLTPIFAAGFRDRDFDYPVQDHLNLIVPRDDKGKIIVTNRTAIENYLLDPSLFFSFIQEKKFEIEGVKNVGDVKRLFNASASEILFYSAARHALGALRKGIGFGTTWTEGSGNLPKYVDKRHCLEQAIFLVKNYLMETRKISPKKLRSKFQYFKSIFDDDFIIQEEYLRWFDGKDLEKTISKRLSGFSFKSYHEFALEHFDFRKFPDLVQLHDILRGTINIQDVIDSSTP